MVVVVLPLLLDIPFLSRWDDDVVFKNCAKAEPKKVLNPVA